MQVNATLSVLANQGSGLPRLSVGEMISVMLRLKYRGRYEVSTLDCIMYMHVCMYLMVARLGNAQIQNFKFKIQNQIQFRGHPGGLQSKERGGMTTVVDLFWCRASGQAATNPRCRFSKFSVTIPFSHEPQFIRYLLQTVATASF